MTGGTKEEPLAPRPRCEEGSGPAFVLGACEMRTCMPNLPGVSLLDNWGPHLHSPIPSLSLCHPFTYSPTATKFRLSFIQTKTLLIFAVVLIETV